MLHVTMCYAPHQAAQAVTDCRSRCTCLLSTHPLMSSHPPEPRVGPGPGPDSLWAGYTWEQLEALEAEGRVLITDHGGFVLINVYGCVHTRLCSVFGL